MSDKPERCNPCEVGIWSASLIPQPWMQSRQHIWSTLCHRCGKRYFNWRESVWYDAKEGAET